MAEKQTKKAEKPDFKITIEVLTKEFLKDGEEAEKVLHARGIYWRQRTMKVWRPTCMVRRTRNITPAGSYQSWSDVVD